MAVLAQRCGPALLALMCAPCIVLATGCKSVYYQTLETFGKHKRDLLVDRVQAARDDQTEAKEQFQDALTQFGELVHFDGGDLEKLYRRLSSEYEESEEKAKAVSARIRSIEEVARDLFKEWQDELDQYSSADLRRASAKQLRATQERYGDLIDAMKRAEKKMQPVLAAFRDRVLFLKHDLNARAIASLRGEVGVLEDDVARLIQDMDASIREANEFIDSLTQG